MIHKGMFEIEYEAEAADQSDPSSIDYFVATKVWANGIELHLGAQDMSVLDRALQHTWNVSSQESTANDY